MNNSSYKSNIRNISCNLFNKIINDNQKSRQMEKDILMKMELLKIGIIKYLNHYI